MTTTKKRKKRPTKSRTARPRTSKRKRSTKRDKKIRIIEIIAAIIFIAWVFWGNVTMSVTHYHVTNQTLPAEFDHLKIVLVSDLHNAESGDENSTFIQTIEKEKPDYIAITGDLVDASRTDIDKAIACVKQLTKIARCYYVPGNHEAWINEQYQTLEEQLKAAGVIVLQDNYVTLGKNGSYLQIAGLRDPAFTEPENELQEEVLRTNLKKMALPDAFCILLSHRPEAFQVYASEGIDLVLSGHAHGGQFRIPFLGGIYAPNQGLFPKYDGGMYTEQGTTMIVSRGIGNSVIPVRVNNRPELVVIELSRD